MRTEKLAFRNDFFAAKERITEFAEIERQLLYDGMPWPKYVASARSYESFFSSISPETFTNFITRRRVQKGKFFAMDVMGTGNFLGLGEVNGEAAMTLVDFRNDEQKDTDRKNNRLVIAGNILRNRPWLDAQKFIETHDNTNLPGFDLITCRPWDGWATIRNSKHDTNPNLELLERIIVERMVRLLSPNGGVLLTQMNVGRDYSKWIDTLQQVKGIQVEGKNNLIKIEKIANGPISLPNIFGVKKT